MRAGWASRPEYFSYFIIFYYHLLGGFAYQGNRDVELPESAQSLIEHMECLLSNFLVLLDDHLHASYGLQCFDQSKYVVNACPQEA